MSEYPLPYNSKRILLFVARSNFSADSLAEALRFAVGLSGGLVGHKLDIVFIGDGVTECLAERCTDNAKPYLLSAKSCGVQFFADSFSLKQREIKEERLLAECSAISPEDLSKLLKESEIHLRL
ncbi:DsrE family protein [bacterium]|nr:DsrE family protein [bacterium]